MPAKIPSSSLKRIVIIGAGFGGLQLARNLIKSKFQVVLIDRQNYHQFQPLFYQVATAGIAPSAISFPIRTLFHNAPNVHFRVAEVNSIKPQSNKVETSIGEIEYDHLVIATGADTNFFGNESVARNAFPMKTTSESLKIRNHILQCMEEVLVSDNESDRHAHLSIVIVGAGPTGVELAGAFAEMRKYVLPKDYPELDFDQMQIHLIEAGSRILGTMSDKSTEASHRFLKELGVNCMTKSLVTSYDGNIVEIKDSASISAKTMIWSAGIKGNIIEGIDSENVKNNRYLVNEHNQIIATPNVYAIGDAAYMEEGKFQNGHPQVAQVAMQQASLLSKNLIRLINNQPLKPFAYKDLGSMATIGRSKAVVDLPGIHFNGFAAWIFWLFVHLMNILGVKNKLFIFIDWMWYYISFSQSLRLVITTKQKSPD